MKSHRFVLSAVLLSLSSLAFAQSDAQKSFDQLKTLAGSWEGHVTTVPPAADIEGKLMHTSLRVTSMRNAIMHEMTGAGRPDDPITMLYVDEGRLMLTHYCDAGNRPRMAGKVSSDGKTVNSIFSTLPAARSTDTCTMQCSPSSMRTTTSRTGLIWNQETSPSTPTSTCSVQGDGSYSGKVAVGKTGWTVSGTTISRFTASCATVWSR